MNNKLLKIVVVVQARMSSSRLPGKVLFPILGESLLFRMIERLRRVKYPIDIVVATSTDQTDKIIEVVCQEKGIEVFRGKINDLLDRHYQIGLLKQADAVIKIPSDCPLIDPIIVDRIIDFYLEHETQYDYVSNLHPATYPDGNDVELMTFSALDQAWQEAQKPLELEHTTPYFWENPDKFRIANLTWETGLDYSMSHRFTIDYYEDYQFIKRIFESLYPNNPEFSLEDILNLIDSKPDIYDINKKCLGVNWYSKHLLELKTITPEQTRDLALSNEL